MNMQKDNTPATCRPKPKLRQRVRASLCTGILILTLGIAGLLAIPACLIIGLMGAVWDLGDKLLSRLSG